MSPNEIKQIRDKLGLSQEKFAFKVGATAQTVSRWERGEFKPLPIYEKRMANLSERYLSKGE